MFEAAEGNEQADRAEIHKVQDRTGAVLEKVGHPLDEVTGKLDALITVIDGLVKRPGTPPVS